MPSGDMQIHEVNDGPQAYPIDQIARSSTKNKTETEKKRSAEAGGSGHIKNEPPLQAWRRGKARIASRYPAG